MKSSKGLQFVGLLGSVFLAGASQAGNVTTLYDFPLNDQTPTVSDLAFETIDAAIGSGGFNGNGGFTSEAAFARTINTSDELTNAPIPANGALDGNDYFSFKVDFSDQGILDGLTSYDVLSISFDHTMSSTTNGATYQAFLFSSATGFGENDFLASTSITGISESSSVSAPTATFNVETDATVQEKLDLSNRSGETEFRIYVTSTSFVQGHLHLIDNVLITTTPEPGSLALLGMGGVLLIWRRRPA